MGNETSLTEQDEQQERMESLELKVTAILPSGQAPVQGRPSAPIDSQSKKQYHTIASYQSETKL